MLGFLQAEPHGSSMEWMTAYLLSGGRVSFRGLRSMFEYLSITQLQRGFIAYEDIRQGLLIGEALIESEITAHIEIVFECGLITTSAFQDGYRRMILVETTAEGEVRFIRRVLNEITARTNGCVFAALEKFRRDCSPLLLAPSDAGRYQEKRDTTFKTSSSQRGGTPREDSFANDRNGKMMSDKGTNFRRLPEPTQEQEAHLTASPPPHPPLPPQKDNFEVSDLGIGYLAEIRRVDAMDMLFPQIKHDQVLAIIFIAFKLLDISAHKDLIDFVMAIKDCGSIPNMENISKTKVRGVIALMKLAGIIEMSGGVDAAAATATASATSSADLQPSGSGGGGGSRKSPPGSSRKSYSCDTTPRAAATHQQHATTTQDDSQQPQDDTNGKPPSSSQSQPVKLSLCRNVFSFEALRERHDIFLCSYGGEARVSLQRKESEWNKVVWGRPEIFAQKLNAMESFIPRLLSCEPVIDYIDRADRAALGEIVLHKEEGLKIQRVYDSFSFSWPRPNIRKVRPVGVFPQRRRTSQQGSSSSDLSHNHHTTMISPSNSNINSASSSTSSSRRPSLSRGGEGFLPRSGGGGGGSSGVSSSGGSRDGGGGQDYSLSSLADELKRGTGTGTSGMMSADATSFSPHGSLRRPSGFGCNSPPETSRNVSAALERLIQQPYRLHEPLLQTYRSSPRRALDDSLIQCYSPTIRPRGDLHNNMDRAITPPVRLSTQQSPMGVGGFFPYFALDDLNPAAEEYTPNPFYRHQHF